MHRPYAVKVEELVGKLRRPRRPPPAADAGDQSSKPSSKNYTYDIAGTALPQKTLQAPGTYPALGATLDLTNTQLPKSITPNPNSALANSTTYSTFPGLASATPLAAEPRSEYLIAFEAAGSGAAEGYHSLKLKSKPRGLGVRSREALVVSGSLPGRR